MKLRKLKSTRSQISMTSEVQDSGVCGAVVDYDAVTKQITITR